jgi:adenylate kinase
MTAKHIVLFGPPGCGKGTQSKMLQTALGCPRLSTGEILREEKRNQTDLGKRVAKYIDIGQFIPSDLITEIVMSRLPDEQTILDGFPRTADQGEFFKDRVSHFIHLDLPDHLVLKRLLAREGDRVDDTAEVIQDRLAVYHTISYQTVGIYQPLGLVHKIDADQSIGTVFDLILKIVTND